MAKGDTLINPRDALGAVEIAGIDQAVIHPSGEGPRARISPQQERRLQDGCEPLRLGHAGCRWQAQQLGAHDRRGRRRVGLALEIAALSRQHTTLKRADDTNDINILSNRMNRTIQKLPNIAENRKRT